MTIPKVNVTVDTYQLTGQALPNATARITLTRGDIVAATGEVVGMGSTQVVCDPNGHGVGAFFPNVLGTQGTQYLVEIFDSYGLQVFPSDGRQVPAVIPNQDCSLTACLFTIPPLSQGDAAAAVADARTSAQQAQAAAATSAAVHVYPGVFDINALPAVRPATGLASQPGDMLTGSDGHTYIRQSNGTWTSPDKTAQDAAAAAQAAAGSSGSGGLGNIDALPALAGPLDGTDRVIVKDTINRKATLADFLLWLAQNGDHDAFFATLKSQGAALFGAKYGYDAAVGYGGGSVVQNNSKAQALTLNAPVGQITMNAASLAAGATVTFTLTNSFIGADDEVSCWKKGGGTTSAYSVTVESVAAGSCVVSVTNKTAGALAEALVIGFAVRAGAIGPVVGIGGPLAGMLLGMNAGALTYYQGAVPFSNLMWRAGMWQGPIASTYNNYPNQNSGLISGAGVNDAFVAQIVGLNSTVTNLPQGVYTVRNPDGCTIGIGTGAGGPDLIAYTTNTQFNFTISAPNQTLYVFCKGNLTNNAGTAAGALAIILPNHLAKFNSGDYFNQQWVDWHTAMGTALLRTMDWGSTNTNIETDWADRSTFSGITFNTPAAGSIGYNCVPWELRVAAANKLNIPLWINIPVRATAAYVTALASLVQTLLNPGIPYVAVEHANEPWNSRQSFSAGYNWIRSYPYTRLTASVNAATGRLTKNAHGMATDAHLMVWTTLANRQANLDDATYYSAAWGGDFFIRVIDANTFELWDKVSTDPTAVKYSFPTGVTSLIYINVGEAGKSLSYTAYYTTFSKADWDIFDAALGAARVKAVVGSQAAGAQGYSAGFLAANAPATARANWLAIAPYYRGIRVGGALDLAPGQFTPKVWTSDNSNGGNTLFTVGVYALGSTPTKADVKNGTGAGYIGKSAIAATYTGNGYTSGAPITGLVNGTTYAVFFVAVDQLGYTWMWSQNVAASAVASTVDVLDSYTNQMLRSLIHIDHPSDRGSNVGQLMADHIGIAVAANANLKVVGYEWGDHQDESAPTAIDNWSKAWLKDATHGIVLDHGLHQLTAAGMKAVCFYQDVGGSPGIWTAADNYGDQLDVRFQKLSGYRGNVPLSTLVDVAPVSAQGPTAQPGAFPVVAYTMTDATLTYSLVSGDDRGNFDFSGANLRLITNNGINWATSAVYALKARATDGETESFFPLNIALGPIPWYEPDALFALKMTTQASNQALTPDVGGTLPITNGGAGGTLAGGTLDVLTTQYSSATALTQGLDPTVPFLIAVVGRIDNTTSGYNQLIQVGAGGHLITIYPVNGGGTAQWRWYAGAGYDHFSGNVPYDNTLAVHWFHNDGNGNVTIGHNQITDDTSIVMGAGMPTANMGQELDIFPNDDVIGSIEIVQRAGLSVATAKTIVQKLQTIHSIP